MDNRLEVKTEDGKFTTIYVWDIIRSPMHMKTFMIYSFEEDGDIYGAILEEEDNTYSLSPIVREDEIKYIDVEIDRVAEEFNMTHGV